MGSSAWVKVVLSALTAGIVAGAGAAIAALTSLSPGEPIPTLPIWVSVLTGIVSAAKDVQSYLTDSPTTGL